MIGALKFPLRLKFNITTIANDFLVTDALDKTVFYVSQKFLHLKSDILIFSDESKENLLYKIILEGPLLSFDVTLSFYNEQNQYIGNLRHPSIESNWTAYYQVYNVIDELQFEIYDDDPWVKVWDRRIKSIPGLGFLTGYFFNPVFSLSDVDSRRLFSLKKNASFIVNKFSLELLTELPNKEKELSLLALFAMILFEENNG